MMILGLCLTLLAGVSCAQAYRKPNFIVILTDDQGFDDYGFRQPPLETPNMDKLMNHGVQFTRFYTASACAPTRSQLMTGRNFWRTGTASVGFGGDAPHLDEYLLGEALQDAGYVTGMVGKWNLGTSDADLPHRRGFNETWEVIAEEIRSRGKYFPFSAPFAHNGSPVGEIRGWQVERITDKGLDFIERHTEEPFFLYLPYPQPHEPWACRWKYQEKYINKGIGESYAMLLGNLEQLDSQVGRILETLERNDLSDDTIVFFFGDNGPTPKTRLLRWQNDRFELTGAEYTLNDTEWAARNPTGLRSKKATGWENAVRNRLAVYCPAKFRAKEVQEMTVVYDIYPTLLQLAGYLDVRKTLRPRMNGRSFQRLLVRDNAYWPQQRAYFTGETGKPKAYKASDGWSYRFTKSHSLPIDERSTSFVLGDWVVVNDNGTWGLFDLSRDPKQEKDLKDILPATFHRMQQGYFSELESIRGEPHAWSDPVQLIGLPGVEQPYLEMEYAYRFKGKNAFTWANSFFEEVGATQEMKVRVLERATYDVELRAERVPGGTTIQLRGGWDTRTVLLNTEKKYHYIGRFTFPVGDQSISTTVVDSHDWEGLRKMLAWSLRLTKVY